MIKRGKVTVFGSFVVDLMSYAPHVPVAGETVRGGPFKAGPGGKGSNQGIAAQKAGADVTMITKLGKDSFADFAWDSFKGCGMKTDFIYTDPDNGTGIALIIVDEHSAQNIIVVAPGACANITQAEVDRAKNEIASSDVLLTQLETNIDAMYSAIDIAFRNNVKVILNPAPYQPFEESLFKKIYAITPNETEAEALSGIKTDTMEGIVKSAAYFREKGVKNAIITLGKKGVYISSDEFTGMIDAIDVGKVIDTTGAGDAFNGGFAAGIAEGRGIRAAALFGCAVSWISVTRVGTAPSMPSRDEVMEVINKFHLEV
ncbi:MAG: ribokinase [Clostridia bacterium]|nr:ribokinase [Clostridia bacterium]MDR3643804.1 ribokinase [Clostridia bacterium]